MRLDKIQKSKNVDDRRRVTGGQKAAGGVGAIVMALIAIFVLKQDPQAVLQDLVTNRQPSAVQSDRELTPQEKAFGEEAEKILWLTEDVWDKIYPYAAEHFSMRNTRRSYDKPKLVLFTGEVPTKCGRGSAGMGPFYCPGDEQVYIDLSFYNELERRFGAPGDFARAYVLAHEVGHHVQKLLGFSDMVHQKRQTLSEAEYNQWSVRLELQADFFAGVWTHRAQKEHDFLERGDLEEGLRAASAVGDDKIQEAATGYVQPDKFTHGTAEQRIRWFRFGLESGDPRSHNPFELPYNQL